MQLQHQDILRAPFPFFGGKSRVASQVWERFGDVRNYVEPFAGSLACLLGRPHPPQIETVNDKDCYISNFWRALQHAPDEVAQWADWPVNEADLTARHRWLVKQVDFRNRMMLDPSYYDAKIAGWWVWGLSAWIGSGWCKVDSEHVPMKRPHLTSQGVNSQQVQIHSKRPHLKGNSGIFSQQVQVDDSHSHLELDRGGLGKRPHLGRYGSGIHAKNRHVVVTQENQSSLYPYMEALATRLRRVRVCCGEWDRVLGPSPTYIQGVTGVFLDPPYPVESLRYPDLYSVDDGTLAHKCQEWAIQNGQNPLLRIALCGYDGIWDMPEYWTVFKWKTQGGYAGMGNTSQENRFRERIWFSPHCLKGEQLSLWSS